GNGRYRDVLPFIELRIPGFNTKRGIDRWGLALIPDWHQSSGWSGLFNPEESSEVLNFRLNLSYEFSFGTQAKLKFIASGDLDQYGSPKSWAGGNGQLSLAF
ncbi:MAG: hypothetical protein AABZ55_01800, partial [Bdellovibrionota bacterium]